MQSAIAPTGAPAHKCPDSDSIYCNSVSFLDLAGRTVDSYDAYGLRTHVLYDLAGHAVRTIANYVPP